MGKLSVNGLLSERVDLGSRCHGVYGQEMKQERQAFRDEMQALLTTVSDVALLFECIEYGKIVSEWIVV